MSVKLETAKQERRKAPRVKLPRRVRVRPFAPQRDLCERPCSDCEPRSLTRTFGHPLSSSKTSRRLVACRRLYFSRANLPLFAERRSFYCPSLAQSGPRGVNPGDRLMSYCQKKVKPSAKIYALIFALLQLLALYQLSSAVAYGAPQEQQRRALGSLTTVGEVHVNDAVAPSDAPIFAGDVLRSAGTGSATFTWSGQGSLQIYPNTELAFTGEPQYAAELKFGRVVMNSWRGATGMNLRAGNSVVLAVAEGEQSVSNIEAPSDGSFLVTCEAGSVGVIPLQGITRRACAALCADLD
jgi:hypothetical protein